MKIKIIRKNGCAILAVLCLIGLCIPFVDAYNGTESSMYSNVKKGQPKRGGGNKKSSIFVL